MIEKITPTLTALRDVQGIEGSFIISPGGNLVTKDLPSIFDAALSGDFGARLNRLIECFLSGGDQVDSGQLKFQDHKLYIKALSRGILCIITTTGVSMPAMKMAVNLALRRINPEIEQVTESMIQAAAAPKVAQPVAVATPAKPAPAKPFRMFRGNIVQD
jgi:predicted regulator of Ras-like GTPase activity (Roadblock/LC7/MglB family)